MNSHFQNAQNPPLKWWLSWSAIIIAFIVFFPIGLFLIWKRSLIDRKAASPLGKIIFILGCVNLLIVFSGLVQCITTEGFASGNISKIIFFLLSGIGLIWIGKKIKNNIDKSEKYISIIANKGILDIDRIAAAIPTSYENAIKDLQNIFDEGFFGGAYINESKRQIIMPQKTQQHSSNQSNMAPESPRMHVVTCKGCGAQNSIAAGTVGDCEFCGSKIEI